MTSSQSLLLSKSLSTLSISKEATSDYIPKYFDVGVNITDKMFDGYYHGKKYNQNDIINVLKKSLIHHVNDILLTGSSLIESKNTIDIVKKLRNDDDIDIPNLYSTVGVHPCTVLEFENESENENEDINTYIEKHLQNLENLIIEGLKLNIVKAFGEIGLDYDRLHYTPMDKQLKYFQIQLELATKFNLPLFLHMRSAVDDFIKIIKPFIENNKLKNKNLLVHSFTGDSNELMKLLDLEKNDYKIFISINGASLRDQSTIDSLHLIPINRLMIETDSPWCEIKKTHPSYKFLTKSPNKFYPSDYENYEKITSNNKINQVLTQQSKKSPSLTLFEFLPIPIIKHDKFDKFQYMELFNETPLIKSRNEPCLIGLVAEVVSKILAIEPEILIDNCYKNSMEVFGEMDTIERT